MAIIGQNVQAGLGRIDYSPYLQGASVGAQGIAQGIAGFGQGVTQGIQNYLKKQEEKKNEQEAITFIKSKVPGIDDATAKAGLKAAGGAAAYVKFRQDYAAEETASRVRSLQLAEMERQAADRPKIAQFAAYLQQGGGQVPSPVNLGAFTPEQVAAGRAQYLQTAGKEAELYKTRAETAAIKAGKPEKMPSGVEALVQDEIAAFIAANNRAPDATEMAKIRRDAMAANRSQTINQVGAGLTGQIYGDLAKEKNDILSLKEAISNYGTAIDEITKSGAFSGPAGAIKYAGARAAQIFGSNAFKDEADAYQSAASALASSVLAIARQLPGASSDKDVIFLNRVVSGDERVPSASVLEKIKARVEAKVSRLESAFQDRIKAFGEASKGDPNAEFAFKVLSAKPSAQLKSFPSF